VITYDVPQGRHTVLVVFANTKIRSLGNILSLVFLGISILFLLIGKRFGLFSHLRAKR